MQQGTLTGLDTETDFTYTGHARVRQATVAACISISSGQISSSYISLCFGPQTV